MAKPKIPNQKKKYKELNGRLSRYVALIGQIYDTLNLEAAKVVSRTDYSSDSEKPFKWSDYPETKKQIDDIQAQFVSDINAVIYRGTSEEWKNSNAAQDLIADKVLKAYTAQVDREKYKVLYQTNSDALKAFRKRKDKGLNVSAKLWNQSVGYKRELEEAISCAIQKGTSAVTLSKQISKYLQDFPSLQKDYKERYGTASRAADCEYRSIRLARSEINMAYRTAENERWKQMDFVVGYEIKTSTSHFHRMPKGDICDDLAGKYPKDFAWTGWHPNCLCYKIPILKTEEEFWEWDGRSEVSTSSVNEVKDVPDAFRQWIENNADRIESAKSLPYFMRDNEKYIKHLTITPQARAGADEAQAFNAKMMRAADVPQVPKARTREEILAAAKERHAARTQEQIDEIKQRYETKKAFDKIEDELKAAGVEYNAPGVRKDTTEAAIIQSLAGGDMTKYGACSSLAFAYAGNRGGIDVLDFRGGVSQLWFAKFQNIMKISNAVGGETVIEHDGFKIAEALLNKISTGKEYYFVCGEHAVIVRKIATGFEYLEMQDPDMAKNKFKPLNKAVLKKRFATKGYAKRDLRGGVLIDIDQLNSTYKFKRLLGYINTEPGKQLKGAGGSIK